MCIIIKKKKKKLVVMSTDESSPKFYKQPALDGALLATNREHLQALIRCIARSGLCDFGVSAAAELIDSAD